ncbi:MAG TPA: peptidylprolyl isomerase [Parvularculaceae bacterium]|nr:peptidylprolyl isomerase [Parvularculaceae bacterium]
MKQMMAALAAAGMLTSVASADPIEGAKSSADILAASAPGDWRPLDPENTLYIETEKGRIVVQLSSKLAQKTVAHVKALARAGFYDGLSFYRVIGGFVAQGGDALETKGKQPTIAAEFDQPAPKDLPFDKLKDKDGYASEVGFVESMPAGMAPKTNRVWLLHCAGAMALGRDNERDTQSTEFYITLQAQRYLDRNLTVFGRVVDGMQYVQALRRLAPPEKPGDDLGDKIVSVKVAADVPAAERTNLEVLDSSRPIFAAYAEARRNRPEAFFYYRPNYLDICQLPIPARPVPAQ